MYKLTFIEVVVLLRKAATTWDVYMYKFVKTHGTTISQEKLYEYYPTKIMTRQQLEKNIKWNIFQRIMSQNKMKL